MKDKRKILGCIADDFTGASDAASFLQKGGLRVVLFCGTPNQSVDTECFDAIVIALKTRTMRMEQAVEESINAIKWLEKNGVTHFYSKYCSTFDSTEEGNIGPIADAIMEYLEVEYTLLCPALPVNGRIVKDGNLYVNGELLSESSMKNHPLTPMRDSSIKRLIEAQSKYIAYNIGIELKEHKKEKKEKHYYLIPDYATDQDARQIVKKYGQLRFLTGGSGLLQFWAELLFESSIRSQNISKIKGQKRSSSGRGIILAGSCSQATLEQIQCYKQSGHPSFQIFPEKLLSECIIKDDIMTFIQNHLNEYVLIYTSDTKENVLNAQKQGKEKIAELIEQTLSDIAAEMIAKGFHNVIVAGGETSGAVTQKLGFSAFQIGDSVAPGVPVMTPLEQETIHLVLKSGNFGQSDFFERAINKVEGKEEK